MKYLSEYRDPALVQALLQELERTITRPWKIMEICGGQTHSLVKNGILQLLPSGLQMLHGPGCPVCVTPEALIDQAVMLALRPEVVLCSFGDMLRVPGTHLSLLQAKAQGADVRVLYSPLEAVQIARQHPERQVVFFAIGFETTAPANALAVLHAARERLKNFSILTSHVLVPPAMEAILSDGEVDAFLAAGHVCSVMGTWEYEPIVARHGRPVVVTGFEPVDLLEGILMAVRQLERGEARLENQYTRVVQPEGNLHARRVIDEVFEVCDREWRGIGTLPASGYRLRPFYSPFDARTKFPSLAQEERKSQACPSGEVMRGRMQPCDCPFFGRACTPEHPMGAPMVSSEGACAAYYHYQHTY